jgi:hypothetical protein
MFGNLFGNPTITALKATLEQRDETIAGLQKEIKQLKEQSEKEGRDCAVSVDWNRMRAFSIERLHDGNKQIATVIGYLKPCPEKADTDMVGEWWLYCNKETHDRLVAEFNNYRRTE